MQYSEHRWQDIFGESLVTEKYWIRSGVKKEIVKMVFFHVFLLFCTIFTDRHCNRLILSKSRTLLSVCVTIFPRGWWQKYSDYMTTNDVIDLIALEVTSNDYMCATMKSYFYIPPQKAAPPEAGAEELAYSEDCSSLKLQTLAHTLTEFNSQNAFLVENVLLCREPIQGMGKISLVKILFYTVTFMSVENFRPRSKPGWA